MDTLHQELVDRFEEFGNSDYKVPELRKHVSVEKLHGRRERREYYAMPVDENDELRNRWPGLETIGMIYRRRQAGEKLYEETMFYITSREAKVKRLSQLIRGHWSIENAQHWVLDVTFTEDASRIRKGGLPEITGAFRRMALNILQRDTTVKDSIRGQRMRAGLDESLLSGIYAGLSGV